MRFLQAINSDLSVLIVCNKTGDTIKRRYKKNILLTVCCCLCLAVLPTVSLATLQFDKYTASFNFLPD